MGFPLGWTMMRDGTADWADQVRALGNAVSPPQAELALRVLWERLHGEALP